MQPPGLYGFSEVTQYGRKLLARKAELDQRVRDLKSTARWRFQQVTFWKGALEDFGLFFHTIFGVCAGKQLNRGLTMANFSINNSTGQRLWRYGAIDGCHLQDLCSNCGRIIVCRQRRHQVVVRPRPKCIGRGKIYDILIGTNGTPADNLLPLICPV